MQINFKMDSIFLIITKCESKNYLYIYYIKLIKENNQFKKKITSKQVFFFTCSKKLFLLTHQTCLFFF